MQTACSVFTYILPLENFDRIEQAWSFSRGRQVCVIHMYLLRVHRVESMKKSRLFFPFFINRFSKYIFFNPLQFQDQFKITQTNVWNRTVPASSAHGKLLFNCPPSCKTFPKLSRAFPHCSSWLTSNILFNSDYRSVKAATNCCSSFWPHARMGTKSFARGLEAAGELALPRRRRRRAGEQ